MLLSIPSSWYVSCLVLAIIPGFCFSFCHWFWKILGHYSLNIILFYTFLKSFSDIQLHTCYIFEKCLTVLECFVPCLFILSSLWIFVWDSPADLSLSSLIISSAVSSLPIRLSKAIFIYAIEVLNSSIFFQLFLRISTSLLSISICSWCSLHFLLEPIIYYS